MIPRETDPEDILSATLNESWHSVVKMNDGASLCPYPNREGDVW